MRNTILTAMILMLVPGMALAQFYTITKESGTIKVQASNKENSIDNKEDIDKTKSVELQYLIFEKSNKDENEKNS